MAVIGSTSDLSGGLLSPSSNVRITNLTMATANTEYSHNLIDNLKMLQIRFRNKSKAQISFVTSESGTKYFTILPGNIYEVNGLNFSSKVIYVQTSSNNEVMEVIEYY